MKRLITIYYTDEYGERCVLIARTDTEAEYKAWLKAVRSSGFIIRSLDSEPHADVLIPVSRISAIKVVYEGGEDKPVVRRGRPPKREVAP